jgi:competence protein ComEA
VPSLAAACRPGRRIAADKVDVNTADAATIDRVLLNIGPVQGEAIVAHRTANGPYKSLEQLAQVKGIGLKTVEKNRDRIELGRGRRREEGRAAPTPARPDGGDALEAAHQVTFRRRAAVGRDVVRGPVATDCAGLALLPRFARRLRA